jgi:hypothetical protein
LKISYRRYLLLTTNSKGTSPALPKKEENYNSVWKEFNLTLPANPIVGLLYIWLSLHPWA